MRPQGFANSKLTKTMEKTDIGLIGLAVMGENLALNMESKGFSVSVYNRTAPGEKGVVDRFVAGRGNGKRFTGTHSIRELVGSVRRPRRIMMMVRAGEAVDELIAQLTPLMEPGDVIIDGGNSAFQDTARRVKEVENRGLYFVGAGSPAGRKGPCTARRSCREVRRKHGRWSKTYCRASPRSWTTAPRAANGSAAAEPGTSSKRCITASSTAICS